MGKFKRKSDHENSKSKKSKVDGADDTLHDASVFGELVTRCGIVLKPGNKPNELKTDQAVFQRDLTLALKRHPDFPEVVNEFTEALTNHIEQPLRFFRSMMPSKTSGDADASARGGQQESMMRLLLGVDLLQPPIMNMLLEKLAEFTGEDECIIEQNEYVNIPRLIMSQFRWLDKIVNSKDVTAKMLEIVCIVSPDAQREIITCIPEVVDDSEHGDVARELRDLLTQNNELAVPILDALSNLSLGADLLADVRGSVVQSLPSVALEDLPVIVRFLLQTVTSQDALQVIAELRAHLDLDASSPASVSSTSGSGRTRKPSDASTLRGSEALTLDAIRSGIRFQKSIAEAWIKAIDQVKTSAEHKVVDLCVLLILHANSYRKPVESLIRNKVRAGHFTELLLQSTFGVHGQILRDYFPCVLSLSEVLLRSPEPVIGYFACAMYKHAFLAFDTYCQQEIVGNLVTHIGSGFAGEIDSSLDILATLVEQHPGKMTPFAIFVKGVLDYLDQLSVGQIRKLYSLLSTLAFRSPAEEGLIQDDMHIVIRKQLSSNNNKYKRMGVIGAISVVKSMAHKGSVDQSSSSDQDAPLSEEVYRQVVSLLQLVRASSARSPEAAALFMDELATAIRKGIIDERIENWVGEHVISDFQDDFVADLEPNITDLEAVLPVSAEYGLDEANEGAIAINMLPLLATEIQNKRHPSGNPQGDRSVSLVCLSPHFRLLQLCERRQHDDDLEGIDALLGCPVYLPNSELFDKMESLSDKEKSLICDSLFLTINWFREVINAFASQGDVEMKGKVISRLQNLTELQTALEKCLAVHRIYRPPPANFDWDDDQKNNPSVTSGSTGGKRGRKPGGKGKKKGKGDKENQGEEEDEDSRDSTVIEKDTQTQQEDAQEKEVEKPSADLNQYKQYFRELDLEVFTVLKIGLITRASLDSEMNTKDTTTLELQPPQLELLLADLVRKLEHALIASASKRRTFLKVRGDKNCGFSQLDHLKPSQVVNNTIRLLPSLCEHLEGTSAFFQALIATNDGVLDAVGFQGPEVKEMGVCFQLLLQAILALFSWAGFVMNEHRTVLRQALGVLSSRLNSAAESQATMQDLFKQAFHYMENFSSTVPNLASAVILTKFLVVLAERSGSDQLGEKIAAVSEGFLKRGWFGPDGQREKGAKYNELLQQLLKIYVTHSEDVLASLENLSTVGVQELLKTDKNGCSETYPTLTRNSYSVFYRVILSELVGCAKAIESGKQSDSEEVKMERLLRWNLAVRIFHVMVNLIKAFDGRSNLGAVLKYGRQFVEVFLKGGMPLMDHVFRARRDDVLSLLKNLQLSTRSLQHMCGHSKIMKDLSLTNQVPPLRKCLEAFVYRVKAMLTLNKCLEAFWLGNLKNRDLQGEEILSQSTTANSSNGDSDQEADVMPDDDDDSDVEVDKESEGSNEQANNKDSGSDDESYSESY